MKSLSRLLLIVLVLVLVIVLVIVLVLVLAAALTRFLVWSPQVFGLILGGGAVVAMIVVGVQIATSGSGAVKRVDPERDRASAQVEGRPVAVVTVLGPGRRRGDR